MSKRIQKKGFYGKIPPNTVYVGRPSKWRNPYRLEEYPREQCIDLYRVWIYQQIQRDPHYLDALRGKDLACFCKLEDRCHADVLLELLEMGL